MRSVQDCGTHARSVIALSPVIGTHPNLARFKVLAPTSRSVYPDWDTVADIAVAILRTEAGRNPHDKELHDLVGELCTRSDEFRTRWGAHGVRHHGTSTKRFHHQGDGELHDAEIFVLSRTKVLAIFAELLFQAPISP